MDNQTKTLNIFCESLIDYIEDHSRKNTSGVFMLDSVNLCKEICRLYKTTTNKNLRGGE